MKKEITDYETVERTETEEYKTYETVERTEEVTFCDFCGKRAENPRTVAIEPHVDKPTKSELAMAIRGPGEVVHKTAGVRHTRNVDIEEIVRVFEAIGIKAAATRDICMSCLEDLDVGIAKSADFMVDTRQIDDMRSTVVLGPNDAVVDNFNRTVTLALIAICSAVGAILAGGWIITTLFVLSIIYVAMNVYYA